MKATPVAFFAAYVLDHRPIDRVEEIRIHLQVKLFPEGAPRCHLIESGKKRYKPRSRPEEAQSVVFH